MLQLLMPVKTPPLFIYIILALYIIGAAVSSYVAYKEQAVISAGGTNPLFRNLAENAWIRRGFDPHRVTEIPQARTESSDGQWFRFESEQITVSASPLPDLPGRAFLYPKRERDEEFTFAFPIEMDSAAIAYLNENPLAQPGVYFGFLGRNWEIYFNGALVYSEIHLDEEGQITKPGLWYFMSIPLERSLVVPGTNMLTLRIIGEASSAGTGLAVNQNYFDDYSVIQGRGFPGLNTFNIYFHIFAGIYCLFLFFSVRKKSEIFYLYFGVYSLLYSFNKIVMLGIIQTNIDLYFVGWAAISLMPAILWMFVESIGRGKITVITKVFLASRIVCILAVGLAPSPDFLQEMNFILNITYLLYYTYAVFVGIIHFYFRDKKGPRKTGAALDASVVYIFVLMVFSYILDSLSLVSGMVFLIDVSAGVSFTMSMVQIGMFFIIARRFSEMYKRLEKSNVILEATVKERTRELEEQTEIAVRANNAKSEFLAVMSHELRTPLNAVIGFSELELRNKHEESSRENISRIRQSGSYLLGIINDILDIQKIETGKFEIVPVVYETPALISAAVNLNRIRIGAKPIQFILEINSDFPAKLTGDEIRIKQILNNLLSNAIKYTKEGTVTLAISYEHSKRENEQQPSVTKQDNVIIYFKVKDTGIGIQSEDIEKLFKDYAQVDTQANRKVEGTGLGLSIAKRLAQMMGGDISVESEYGKGSCFTAWIVQGQPGTSSIGEEAAEALRGFRYSFDYFDTDAAVVPDQGQPYGSAHTEQFPALIVDDKPLNLLVLRGLLKPYGLQVDTAASGQEAITKTQKKHYGLIFMDHMMPEMDGVEAMRAVKENRLYADVPIIAVTSNALHGMRDFYLEQGFSGFISKPVIPRELDEVIKKHFTMSRVGRQGRTSYQFAINSEEGKGNVFSIEIIEQNIDKLNHFRFAFESGAVIDADWLRRFTALIESFNTADLPETFREQAAALIDAAQREDSAAIRRALPAFCVELNEWSAKNEQGGESKIAVEIVQRLKNAIQNGDTAAVGKAVTALGVVRLSPEERERYFIIYDALMDDNREKALESIEEWLKY